MKTIVDIIQSNIDEDVKELEAYKGWYINCAALADDMNLPKEKDAYMDAALHLEHCIQTIRTIPACRRTNEWSNKSPHTKYSQHKIQ